MKFAWFLSVSLLLFPFGAQAELCDDIDNIGCCDPSGDLVYCASGTTINKDCPLNDCGWIFSKNWYECGGNGAVSPDPNFPIECDQSCSPYCGGKQCGDNGCGGSCGTCPSGSTCNGAQCIPSSPAGGSCLGTPCNGLGSDGECWCDNQCVQNNDCCNDACTTCGFCGGNCTPNCSGKSCGDDGCGGSCGSCSPGHECQFGACIATESGEDTCQDHCGGQGANGICYCDQACVTQGDCCPDACAICGHCGGCSPTCSGKSCGDDGCGGSCGSCPAGLLCQGGQCGGNCTPDCLQKECGSDLCGGSCGACGPNEICDDTAIPWYCKPDPNGPSDCVPLCTGKVCGADGCGGLCGTCNTGETCSAAGTQCVTSSTTEPSNSDDDLRTISPGEVNTGTQSNGSSEGGDDGGCQTSSTIPLHLLFGVLMLSVLLACRRRGRQ